MEQNKTYIVILIVSLTAAALVAAGIFLFSPLNRDAGEENAGNIFDPYTYIRKPAETAQGAEETQEVRAADAIIGLFPSESPEEFSEPLVFRQQQFYGEQDPSQDAAGADETATSGTIVRRAQRESPQAEDRGEVSAKEGKEGFVSVASTGRNAGSSTAGSTVADSLPQGAQKASGSSAGAPKSSAARTEVAKSSTSTSSTGPRTVALRSSAQAPASPAETDLVAEYWIQLFASTSHQAVIDVRQELHGTGINGKISARKIHGIVYFRLRFGPFGVLDEAKKFLTWIRNSEDYKDSYISQELREE